jgi:phosphoglycolate phosphatase
MREQRQHASVTRSSQDAAPLTIFRWPARYCRHQPTIARSIQRASGGRSRLWDNGWMSDEPTGLVVWDVDGTLIPADLRWLRRAIARTYRLREDAITFPAKRVHGYTDESIVIDTAVGSGVEPDLAEAGIPRFHDILLQIMDEGCAELAQEQAAYPGAAETILALHQRGFVQTVLTGNLRAAAELKLSTTGLDSLIDFDIGGYGSDARDRFVLPGIVTRRFADRFGRPLNRRRTVLIGDAENDIATARQAGFHAIAVAQRSSREELAKYRPDAVVDGLTAEVVDLVVSLVERSSEPEAL